MNAPHLVTLELILLSLLAGCSNLPADQACRAGLEKELEVFDANGYLMWNHRSPNFVAFLVEAELDELAGDYQSCVDNLAWRMSTATVTVTTPGTAHIHRKGRVRITAVRVRPARLTPAVRVANRISRH